MNLNESKIELLMDLQRYCGFEVNFILNQLGLVSPEEKRFERKEKLKEIFGNDFQ
jgi:hypothetical protein